MIDEIIGSRVSQIGFAMPDPPMEGGGEEEETTTEDDTPANSLG